MRIKSFYLAAALALTLPCVGLQTQLLADTTVVTPGVTTVVPKVITKDIPIGKNYSTYPWWNWKRYYYGNSDDGTSLSGDHHHHGHHKHHKHHGHHHHGHHGDHGDHHGGGHHK